MLGKEKQPIDSEESFDVDEAGVSDLVALYEKTEDIYARASAYADTEPVSYLSDSTNVMVDNADVG